MASASEKPDNLWRPVMPKHGKNGKLEMPDLNKNPWRNKLKNGRLKHLSDDPTFEATQHPTIKKLMVYVSDTMLDVTDDINSSTEALNKLKVHSHRRQLPRRQTGSERKSSDFPTQFT
ncbi:hypothetical protein THAOC_03874 [Thalassiosira oceanica]|uniref:Uncharacterized protein n=1 Tax=Thalassiosira oceanica TaxID=159749 RepID=K0TA93_THAOC|nr:hypothetical protein THAOC_03874 [Thalassiosira oceanica]|eukprot:EJK74445.1 hypothetical protein THAOC_03874 [Thalassiosira oceanica]